MKLLLDTVAFLWILEDSPRLGPTVRAALADPENAVFLSAASSWEIAVKNRLGKLPLPHPPERLIPAQRRLRCIDALPIDEASALRLGQLPDIHRDPFDRMLVCQAIEHALTIVTPDEILQSYPVRTLWDAPE